MQRIICVLIMLTTPLLLAAGADDDVRKELKALEGKWKAVAGEVAGNPFPKDGIPDFTIVIGADGKSTGHTPKGQFQFTTVNPNKNPKTIDNLQESGELKGKNQYGIYKPERDKFTVNMTPPGRTEGDRPKDFTTKGTTNVVFVFERVKEDKNPQGAAAKWAAGLIRSAQSGPWSAAATWEGTQVPGAGARAQIREGHTVVYDVKSQQPIRMVHVAGTQRRL